MLLANTRMGMTVSECLAETLLHTFKGAASGGVASPHTEGTIDHSPRQNNEAKGERG